MFSRIFEAKQKNVQIVFVLNLVEISKHFLIFISMLLKITETRLDLGPFFSLNTLNYALIFYPVMNISNIS